MGKKRNVEKEKENIFEKTQLLKPDCKDYIVAYYDPDYVKPDEINVHLNDLSKVFPNNNLIALPRMITLVSLGLNELKLYRNVLDKAIADKERVWLKVILISK